MWGAAVIIVDTGAWVGLANRRDQYHQACLNFFKHNREALDFIEFLEHRYSLVPAIGAVPDDTEAFLKAVAGTLGDDFPDDITDEDLGVDSPRETLD